MTMVNSSGSTWKRWEPHAHSPETALNDQFGGDWSDYLTALEQATPALVGVGVTDYFTTAGYRKVREFQKQKRLAGILVFPNIEMRLSIGTKDDQAVNLHLLVSPEDPDHLEKIDAKLASLQYRFGNQDYSCTTSGLQQLGRAFHAHERQKSKEEVRTGVTDAFALSVGANQFKIDFNALCRWRDADPWLKTNTLLAAPNGNDGAGGLPRGGTSTFAGIREELRRASHIILTSNPNDRDYWLGRGVDPLDALRRKYNGPKPCLHGSDAHDINRLKNPGERLCWIKAEPTWRGFLQVLAEPEDRVAIGEAPPELPRTSWVRSVSITGDAWCPAGGIDLNPGLVAVIGSRGSGKTALADLIAYGAQSYEPGPASFLGKARAFVDTASVSMTWGDGEKLQERIDRHRLGTVRPDDDEGESGSSHGRVLYLSQHFVESLCSPGGHRDRLREELERIVFQRLDPAERLGTSSFGELLAVETEALHEAKRNLEDEARFQSQMVAKEHADERTLTETNKRAGVLRADIAKLDAEIKLTAPVKSQKLQADLIKVQTVVDQLEEELKGLAKRGRTIEDLRVELHAAAEDARRRSADAVARLRAACPGLSEEEFSSLTLSFSGAFEKTLDTAAAKLQSEVKRLRGPETPPYQSNSYLHMKEELARLQKALRDAGVVEKRLTEQLKTRARKAQDLKALDDRLVYLGKARERIRSHQTERLNCYKGIIDTLVQEEAILRRLYRPLEQELGRAVNSAKQLSLTVRRRANVADWVERGMDLFDLRKKHPLADPDAMRELAEQHLLGVWEGAADPVAAIQAATSMIGDAAKIHSCLASGATLETFAEWLYATDHVRVDYSVRYDDVDIELLSPGTRGVVLLIIYLKLDSTDDRPIVIDQPEENLDPKSVFAELVQFFKEARNRRQIIMVTHNANLVVNADADQVLIAQSVRTKEPGPPTLRYQVGVLEDEESQRQICAILEGGVQAFRQRDERYKIAIRDES